MLTALVLLHRTNRSTNQASTQSLPGPLSCSSNAMKILARPSPLDGGDIDRAVRWPWCWGSGAGGSCLAITEKSTTAHAVLTHCMRLSHRHTMTRRCSKSQAIGRRRNSSIRCDTAIVSAGWKRQRTVAVHGSWLTLLKRRMSVGSNGRMTDMTMRNAQCANMDVAERNETKDNLLPAVGMLDSVPLHF
jgi:hypothetical protein